MISYRFAEARARARYLREGILLLWTLQHNLDRQDQRSLRSNIEAVSQIYVLTFEALPGWARKGIEDAQDISQREYLRSHLKGGTLLGGMRDEPGSEGERADSQHGLGSPIKE